MTTGLCCDSHKGNGSDFFPVCQGSRPDPTWKLLCPSVLILPLLPWTVRNTGLLLEHPAVAGGSSCTAPGPSPWLWTPAASTQGQWHCQDKMAEMPPPSKSRSDSGPCKDPVPHHLLHPSANSHLLHPCCPWGLRSPAAQ